MLRLSLRVGLLLGAAFIACDGAAQPTRAARMTAVSPAHCVAALDRGLLPDLLRCPSALQAAIEDARARCREAGGELEGVAEGNVWSIDVNEDGRSELAFDLNGNVTCTGAWSLFSCGGLGCPKALYELRAGEWTVIGSLVALAPEQVALGTGRAADGHRALEVCSGDGCAQRSIYEWLGSAYDATRMIVRGARVDVAGSVHGRHALAAATTVRATPDASSAEIGRYDAGTEVAIIGTEEGGDWYYVSPCNACESGFVPKTAVDVR